MSKAQSLFGAMSDSFLGNSPRWYKATIAGFLLANPILFAVSPFVAGWALVLEFILTLAMALRCYPLQPGGLLAIEAVVIGMTSSEAVFTEAQANFEVILLLIFMVAGVYFLKDLLLFTFTKILLSIRSKIALSLTFSATAAVLSAFLDALTVTAVIIAVAMGFFRVYHRVASGKPFSQADHDASVDTQVQTLHREDLERFRAFLRSLVMHAAVGTALGGVTTLVGEPQNLLIGTVAGWQFIEFFLRMAPVSLPVLAAGLATVVALERFALFGYGSRLPDTVRAVLEEFNAEEAKKRTSRDIGVLTVQAAVALFLVAGLALHLAPVGIIGLTVIVLATALNGITQENRLGHAFEEALPFTALLVVFFGIVAVIHEQHLFQPVVDYVLTLEASIQPAVFFIANGVLSAISDNVFVATVYINEVKAALDAGTISREQFDLLTIAINTGTNIPSVATPNGQAAFLFLLTSALAPLIRLSYMRMVVMAFPYLITMSSVGLVAVMSLV